MCDHNLNPTVSELVGIGFINMLYGMRGDLIIKQSRRVLIKDSAMQLPLL